jgi:hypothetical protein
VAFKEAEGIRTADGKFGGKFQGAAFRSGHRLIVAFKGTTPGANAQGFGDFTADIKLGIGVNTHYYARAGEFLESVTSSHLTIYLCGHSLGGAIAQVVGNRYRLPFITFNAPGVGVISRNLGEVLTSPLGPLRAAMTVVTAPLHPIQAGQDLASAFNIVRGANIRLGSDVVGRIGVHYGRVHVIPYTQSDTHGIAKVIEMLGGYRERTLDTLL